MMVLTFPANVSLTDADDAVKILQVCALQKDYCLSTQKTLR